MSVRKYGEIFMLVFRNSKTMFVVTICRDSAKEFPSNCTSYSLVLEKPYKAF